MNTFTNYRPAPYHLLAALSALLLEACTFGATMEQQFTVMETACKDDMSVVITDKIAHLNDEDSWTAECDGMVFDCVASPDAGADCYPRE